MKRLVIVAALAGVILLLFQLGLGDQLTLANLKAQQGAVDAAYRANPLLVLAGFFLVYVTMTAVSFPGAAIMTLAAGALFGVVTGTILVSFASSIGATLAFLASRHVLGDWVQTRFGDRLGALNAGIERDGAFYLFSLRLVPVFPFFLVNLLMGLTRIRTATFYWVSQVGMFLGTIVYVNAGTQLAGIESLSDIASPGLLGSFVALALLPWIGRWIMNIIRKRRIYSRWSRPRRFDRNMVVIGAGAAGLVSSLIGATVRARVTLVESGKMGGDCLNYGCVPSKAIIKSARIADSMRHASRYGLVDQEPDVSFRAVMDRVQETIRIIEPADSVERYSGLGVDVRLGHARIVDPWRVEITPHDGVPETLTTRSIVIAAGAAPIVPDLPGLDDVGFVTSDTLWEEFSRLDSIPRRMVVLGGGPIGCELAQAMARLGSQVTLVQREGRLMPREDEDVSALAAQALASSGVEVLTGQEIVSFARAADGERTALVRGGGDTRTIGFDCLLVAVGRAARLTGYGLEEIGIETGKTVVTDEYLATIYPNIYAAGDVAGPFQFTHTASHQAWYASVNALFGSLRRFKADYRVIPRTTFIDPEVAAVGLNEQQARERNVAHEVTVYPLHELDRAVAESARTGFVKILTVPGKDRILGVTIVADHAGELIAEYVLAMRHGLGLNKILSTIHSYPTMVEANKFAAGVWKKKHAPERLLTWVERYHRWMRG